MYRVLANAVAVFHGVLIVTVMIGSFAAFGGWFRNRTLWTVLFVLLLLSLVLSDLLLGECLLTGVEQRLRNLDVAGSAYSGSFIGHYFGFIPTWVHEWIGPALVIGSFIALPLWQWQAWRSASAQKPPAAAPSQQRVPPR